MLPEAGKQLGEEREVEEPAVPGEVPRYDGVDDAIGVVEVDEREGKDEAGGDRERQSE